MHEDDTIEGYDVAEHNIDNINAGKTLFYLYEINGKEKYDDIFHQFENVVKYLCDEKSGLYFHAYDASKTAFWCDKDTGLCQNFWLRAGCWTVSAGLYRD